MTFAWRLFGVLIACTLFGACRGACSKDEGSVDEETQTEHAREQPLYPVEGVKANPLAERFCAAIHTYPATRRSECCKLPARVEFSKQCTAALSKALEDGAIELREADVATCEAAMKKSLGDDCDWIKATDPPVAPECANIVRGKLAAGTKCRSSLECVSGLRCAGSSMNDPGKCTPPGEPPVFCNIGLDGLAAYTRQDALEVEHPQCNGYCERYRCAAPVAPGGECRLTSWCARGNRCSDGKCVAGAVAQVGEPCTGTDCAPGARCVKKVCVVPKALGEVCSSPLECKSDCIDGKCALACGQLPNVLRKSKTSTAAPN